jgi:hypothetical protein
VKYSGVQENWGMQGGRARDIGERFLGLLRTMCRAPGTKCSLPRGTAAPSEPIAVCGYDWDFRSTWPASLG